ncbi:MAG TPA: CPBP family intramembrane glutamic endopeptidase [Rhizomicrobium sp.]|nr:CPBP family intramembrane glutamic endopeptidase [Rhizomicrobium sp.]
MTHTLVRPIAAVCAAIAITAAMDATGLSNFSALPLFPLMAVFWFWERDSRAEVGFTSGAPRTYLLSVIYPLAILGTIALIAGVAGAVDIAHTNWRKAGLNLALVTVSTIVIAIITEEGFFRGWLWASLRRAGLKPVWVLISTSVVFALWHLSSVVLDTGFNPPPAQVPVFMVNAAVIGAIWGLMRWMSGSVVVSGVSHGVWNGLAYVLFGFGSRVGALGVVNTAVFGPEVGVLGLALNVVFALVVALWWRQAQNGAAPSPK